MFRVLIVVLGCYNISNLSFGAGQRQISLIALLQVLKTLWLLSGWV